MRPDLQSTRTDARGDADGPVKNDRPEARERERPNLDRERQRKGGRMERRANQTKKQADIPRRDSGGFPVRTHAESYISLDLAKCEGPEREGPT